MKLFFYIKLHKKKAHQQFYLKEKDLKRLLDTCELKLSELVNELNEKNSEVEALRQEKINSIRNYKNQAVQQIESLMEQLLNKDAQVNVSYIFIVMSIKRYSLNNT